MPIQYRGVLDEHRAVRQAAGLFDVSHMGELWVSGPEAERFLRELLPNDVGQLSVGRAHYNALLDESGGMLDDLLVYRVEEQRYLLVVNAAHVDADREWIRGRLEGRSGVELEDRSAETALLALQGPGAQTILSPLTTLDLEGIRYYRFGTGAIDGQPALVSRTGYTGEDGFELYLDADEAPALWDRLLEQGVDRGLVPVGLGARDTLRLEAGMLLAGQDFDRSVTPFEVGLDWMVAIDARSFVGREALERQRAEGLRSRLAAFELTGRGIARAGCAMRVDVDGLELSGTVTSGSWSPTLEKAIGLARVASDSPLPPIAPGAPMIAEVRGREVTARVVELPFYRRPKQGSKQGSKQGASGGS